MSRNVRSKLAPALVALLSAMLVACSGGTDSASSDTRPIVLGISQIDTTRNWNTANTESIRQAALEAGIELRLEDAQLSQEKQVAALRSFIDRRVDVIALSPVVESGWEIVLREIRAAGIPVILMDRNIEVSDDSLYVSLIGSDFVEEGRRAARWLLENTRDLPGEIGIVELQGTVGSAPANKRKQGFAEIIADDRRYRILRSQSGHFTREGGKRTMDEFLKAERRRIHVLFAHSDTMALGAVEAIESAGLVPGSDILVISIEGSRQGLEAVLQGKINVTVECSPLLGPQLMATAREVVAGRPVSRHIVTPEAVFTRENAAAALPGRRY